MTTHNYRPDIDGLRAIAIISVLAFHAFPQTVQGGFVGVDIFFVISGFLISNIIFNDLQNNTFSFTDFYQRRIRRIFPALLTVFFSSYCVGYILFTPIEFEYLNQIIAAGSAFVANIILWKKSGYFDIASELKPMLHLWSLSVEEQFYMIWPLMMVLCWKVRFRFIFIITTIALIVVFSFGLNLLTIDQDPVAAFYSPLTRFWELLIGAFLAILKLKEVFITPKYQNALSFCGLGCIGFSLCWLDKSILYPGYWALLPTVGAFCLITSSESVLNKRVLSNTLLVWIGLISYPLYLWHWPILSFLRIVEGETLSTYMRWAAVIISICLAWLTYQYVENPFRRGNRKKEKVIILSALMFLIGLISYLTKENGGLEFRFNKSPLVNREGQITCPPFDTSTKNFCVFGNQESNKTIVVIGDSHAGFLTNALNEAFGKQFKLIYFGNATCFLAKDDSQSCLTIKSELHRLKQSNELYAMIQGQRWHTHNIQSETDLKFVVQHLAEYSPKKIIISGAAPDVDIDCEISNYYGIPLRVKKCLNFQESIHSVKSFMELSQKISLPDNVSFVYPYESICQNNSCTVLSGNTTLYHDVHHLSLDGALRLMPRFKDALDQ